MLPHFGHQLDKFLAAAMVMGFATSVGTYLAPRTALYSPVLDAFLAGRAFARRSLPLAGQALGVGVTTAILLVALDRTLFVPRLPVTYVEATIAPALWTGALFALAGGISEEVVFHYGLLTALVWVAMRWISGPAPYWFATIISALALGIFHVIYPGPGLPLASLVAIRTLVLDVAGVAVTGLLYLRRGLEAAMMAHGVVSFALHVAAPGV